MKYAFLILLCWIGWWGPAAGQLPQQALQQLLQTEGLKHAAVGISVKGVSDGKERVSHCPQVALTPASVAKLLPGWFALQQKGAGYRYVTPVYYTGEIRNGVLDGNMIVEASGDPALGSRYFPDYSLLKALIQSLKQRQVHTVRGKIRVEGARKGTDIPGSWTWEDVSNYYAALYLPFNYHDNMFILRLKTAAPGTEAEVLDVRPEVPGVRLVNEVRAAAGGGDNAWIYGGPYSGVLCVRGTVPAYRDAFPVKGALHDPARAFTRELARSLAREGIRIGGEEVPDSGRVELLSFQSPPLSEILFHTNKASVNLFAEALGRLAGGKDWPQAAAVLLKQAGIDASGITLKDACGLSPMNAVPAQVFTDLLVVAGRLHPEAFMRSLPVAGVDGGLAGYCYAYPALKHRLTAKTGSMGGVRCLSGFLTRKNGEKLAFTVLVNHYTCTPAQLQRAVGKFLDALL